jgi:hypothetical protein
VSEAVCPFCGASLDAAFRSTPPARLPSGRLTRAALVGAVALTPACASVPEDRTGGIVPPDVVADSGLATEIDSGLVGSAYGGPVNFAECTSVQDCEPFDGTATEAVCCMQEQCILGSSATAVACADPLVQMIQASNYDQSCSVDTDCVAVAEGDFCVPGANNCLTAAINKSAESQYLSDVANTNAAFCSAPGSCAVPLTCEGSAGPWCLHGTCEMTTCPSVDAGTDAPFDAQAGDAGDGATANDDAGD